MPYKDAEQDLSSQGEGLEQLTARFLLRQRDCRIGNFPAALQLPRRHRSDSRFAGVPAGLLVPSHWRRGFVSQTFQQSCFDSRIVSVDPATETRVMREVVRHRAMAKGLLLRSSVSELLPRASPAAGAKNPRGGVERLFR